jgi:hypothetical protein
MQEIGELRVKVLGASVGIEYSLKDRYSAKIMLINSRICSFEIDRKQTNDVTEKTEDRNVWGLDRSIRDFDFPR